jgi:protein SCO1/2
MTGTRFAAAARCLGVAGAIVAAALGAAGCKDMFAPPKSPFHGVDVTGADMGADFHLTDHSGKARSLADFRGKAVAIFFGYTHCPDVCPTTLSDMASALQILGTDAARVQVLFVTVDPRRDTPELLRQYVPAFNPTFLGLYGDATATAKVTRDFKIYAQERPGKESGQYTLDHSAQTLVFDRQGRLRLLLPYGIEAAKIASDLRVLLES